MTRDKFTGLTSCEDPLCTLPRKHEGVCDMKAPVEIDYTNWKGTRRKRRVFPVGNFIYGSDPWHPREQWMVEAIDHEDGKTKMFPIEQIHSWREVK